MAEIPEAAYQALLLAVSNARIRGSPGKEEPCAHLGEGKDLPCCIELRCAGAFGRSSESGKARAQKRIFQFFSIRNSSKILVIDGVVVLVVRSMDDNESSKWEWHHGTCAPKHSIAPFILQKKHVAPVHLVFLLG